MWKSSVQQRAEMVCLLALALCRRYNIIYTTSHSSSILNLINLETQKKRKMADPLPPLVLAIKKENKANTVLGAGLLGILIGLEVGLPAPKLLNSTNYSKAHQLGWWLCIGISTACLVSLCFSMILTWCPKFIPTLLCSCAPCQPVIPSYFGGLLCRWAPERREIRPIHIRYLLRGQIILITLDAVVRSIFTHLEKGAVPYVVAVPLGLLLLYYFFLCLSTFVQCCSCCFSDPEMPQHFPTTAPTTITQPPHQHSTTIDIPIRDAIQALETTQPPPQQPSPIHHHATPALQTTQLPPQDSSTTHHARRGLEGQARPLPAVLNATSTTPAATSDDIHIQTHYPHLFRQPSEKLVPAAHSSLAARTALKKLSSIIKHLMSDAQSTGQHHSKSKPVIKKAMVELEGMPFKKFAAMREEWAIKEGYNSPGPVQNIGPRANDVLQAEP